MNTTGHAEQCSIYKSTDLPSGGICNCGLEQKIRENIMASQNGHTPPPQQQEERRPAPVEMQAAPVQSNPVPELPHNLPHFDSEAETRKHIGRVRDYLNRFVYELLQRGEAHDLSKLGPNEKPHFDKMTPILQHLKYGSEQYKESVKLLGPAILHHYQANPHHPEHWKDGINGMDLLDVIEMFCDWMAAGERTANNDPLASLEVNKKRFEISDQLHSIFRNTISRRMQT